MRHFPAHPSADQPRLDEYRRYGRIVDEPGAGPHDNDAHEYKGHV